jgi:hypothetical protein
VLDNAPQQRRRAEEAFSNSDILDPTKDGFGKRFRVIADSLLGVDGSVTTRTDGLAKQLQRTRRTRIALHVRLDGIEKRMRAQYTALDTVMAQLNGQSSYITQQLARSTTAAIPGPVGLRPRRVARHGAIEHDFPPGFSRFGDSSRQGRYRY